MVYQRKRRSALDGTWARICDALRIDCDAEEGEDWTLGLDSMVVRAHQHAAGACRDLLRELSEQASEGKGAVGIGRIG